MTLFVCSCIFFERDLVCLRLIVSVDTESLDFETVACFLRFFVVKDCNDDSFSILVLRGRRRPTFCDVFVSDVVLFLFEHRFDDASMPSLTIVILVSWLTFSA